MGFFVLNKYEHKFLDIYIKNIKMRKVIRITESDLKKIITRVLNEQSIQSQTSTPQITTQSIAKDLNIKYVPQKEKYPPEIALWEDQKRNSMRIGLVYDNDMVFLDLIIIIGNNDYKQPVLFTAMKNSLKPDIEKISNVLGTKPKESDDTLYYFRAKKSNKDLTQDKIKSVIEILKRIKSKLETGKSNG